MKIERLYSNYQKEERLYSTGNDELDELLERAFCEGYEYAQREFGKAERKERRESNRKMKELGISKYDRDAILAQRKFYKKDPEKYKNVEDMSSEDPEVRKRLIKRILKELLSVLFHMRPLLVLVLVPLLDLHLAKLEKVLLLVPLVEPQLELV